MLPPTLPLRGLVLLREAFPVISTCVLQKSEPAMAPEEGSGKLCRICISFYQKCAAELAVSSGRAGGSAPGLSPMQGSVSKSRIIQCWHAKEAWDYFRSDLRMQISGKIRCISAKVQFSPTVSFQNIRTALKANSAFPLPASTAVSHAGFSSL